MMAEQPSDADQLARYYPARVSSRTVNFLALFSNDECHAHYLLLITYCSLLIDYSTLYPSRLFMMTTHYLLHSVLIFSLCAAPAFAADVFSCKDANGNTVYTDSAGNCNGDAQKVKLPDSGKRVLTNYRSPARVYQRIPGDWKILVEEEMAAAEPKFTADVTARLQQMLTGILNKLPPASHAHVRDLNFYLLWGPKSPKGGDSGGMRAVKAVHPVNNPLHDLAWKNGIVIYSASNFMALDDVIDKKDLTHEIGHTWHLRDWPAQHPDIVEAWQAAKQAGLYTNVENYKGKIISSAYALTNEREYFAELSAIYFVGGSYYPYDRAGLKDYDKRGYSIIEQHWGIR